MLASRPTIGMTLAALALSACVCGASVEMVSVTSGGAQGSGDTQGRIASRADGRYVAFASAAPDLVPGDGNTAVDVFVHDRTMGQTTRVSVSTGGAEGDGDSTEPAVGANGRYVAFTSDATNLVPSDTNGVADVFVRDRTSGQTTRVSVSTGGGQADGPSTLSAVSADGRYIAFTSLATNLVPADNNGQRDVFIHDRTTGETVRASVSTAGDEGNGDSSWASISPDGRFVAFASFSSNLVPADTNGSYDVFLRDSLARTTLRVSVSSFGAQGNGDSYGPSVSRHGGFVAFFSWADNLVAGDGNGFRDVFLRDVVSGTTSLVSLATNGAPGDGGSFNPSVSSDVRFVAFESLATTLVPADGNGVADVFVRDTTLDTTGRVSLSTTDTEGDGPSTRPSASGLGRYVAFLSAATDLLPGDANGFADAFVRDLADVVGQAVVGPGGGVVAVADPGSPLDGLRVDVPAGAVAANTTFAVAEVLGGPAPPYGPIGPPFALSPEGAQFAAPVTVGVPHDPALVYNMPVRVYWWDEGAGAWSMTGLTNVSENATLTPNVVSFDTTHFTVFQVACAPPVADAPVDDDDEGSSFCFVATAAYGSPMASEVEALRGWRDRELTRSAAGRVFVDAYYCCGPLAARAIEGNEQARAVSRLCLRPLLRLAGPRPAGD